MLSFPIYSVITLFPNEQGYDVPVEGDWVTIAVVAGPLRHTTAHVGVDKDDTPGLAVEESDIKERIQVRMLAEAPSLYVVTYMQACQARFSAGGESRA